ncbi:MAG: SRPBCC domain-containing protein, partial [Chloroflexia bacterium]|nr:SRPBCC domain-containing protein [Chloroflexia bacterium]
MTNSGDPTTTAPTDEPIFTMTRTFDAPRELVFTAWTDPAHLAQWWGPHGFTNPVCEVDLRPGGAWRIDMQGPDGTIYPNKGVYQEIVPPERLVFSDVVDEGADAWGEQAPPSSISTVTFAELDGRTTVTMVTRLQSIAARDAMLEMG